MRLMITGGPKCGKTTLAAKLWIQYGFTVRHTDDVINRIHWSTTSDTVVKWLDEPGPWIIEGVAGLRALRKWFAQNSIGIPADKVIWMDRPMHSRTVRQEALAKGCLSIWNEVKPMLLAAGVSVEER